MLIALDRLKDGPAFSAEDQRLLEAFAASAATAIATAETVDAERRRQRLAAAEQERARWARELHDETLQNLAAVRLGLAAQLRRPSPDAMIETVTEAVAQLEDEIATLRALITDLRPAALDDLGTRGGDRGPRGAHPQPRARGGPHRRARLRAGRAAGPAMPPSLRPRCIGSSRRP